MITTGYAIYFPGDPDIRAYAEANKLNKFYVQIGSDMRVYEYLVAAYDNVVHMTRYFLESPDCDCVAEAERFFWCLQSNVTEIIQRYYQDMLALFHEKGLLLFKKDVVITQSRKTTRRFLVSFCDSTGAVKMTKIFNSIKDVSSACGIQIESLYSRLELK